MCLWAMWGHLHQLQLATWRVVAQSCAIFGSLSIFLLQYHTLLWTGHLAKTSDQDSPLLPNPEGKRQYAMSLANDKFVNGTLNV